jgi:hypothetical protein
MTARLDCCLSVLLAAVGMALSTTAGAEGLKLTGPTGQALSLTPSEIAALPHVRLSVSLEGKTLAFSGVPLTTLLDRVGAPTGKALRGKAMCDVVVASGRDGYGVALDLAETDPMFRKNQILVADLADGAPMDDQAGPLRLVVEGDLRGARFVRQLSAIVVTTAPACGRDR